MPTFGTNSVGASMNDSAQYQLNATKFTLAETGVVNSITLYIGAQVASWLPNTLRMGIYNDDNGVPSSLIVETADFTINQSSFWITQSISPVTLPPGIYWLAVKPYSNRFGYTYDTGSTNQYAYNYGNDAPLSDPFTPLGYSTYNISIYASYTKYSGETPLAATITSKDITGGRSQTPISTMAAVPRAKALTDETKWVGALLIDPTTGKPFGDTLPIWVQLKPGSTITNGWKTVTTAGTAEAVGASQSILSVTVKALSTNNGQVYVGNSSVSATNGFELDAKESVTIDTDDLADVYVDAAVSGEGVCFIAVLP